MAKQNKPTKGQKGKANRQQESKPKKAKDTVTFPLNSENYLIAGLGMLIMVIGYILMAGKEDIFSFTKLSLSTIFVLLGFAVIGYAIVKKPKKKTEE